MNLPTPASRAVPGASPEPPRVDLGRGRFRLMQARARLALRSFESGWTVFVESRIGLVSLVTIVVFALMALSHPILMATVWDAETYDPVTGYAFDETEQPRPAQLEAPTGHRPLGAGRSEPAPLKHRIGVHPWDNRRAGDGDHRNHRRRSCRLLRRAYRRVLHEACGPHHRASEHLPAHRLERSLRAQSLLPRPPDRRARRLRRHRDSIEVPGAEHQGQALHRGGASGRRQPVPHHLRAYRPEPAAPSPCST